MNCAQSKCETTSRLMRYSLAAGLGAFAFGASATTAEIVYFDCGPAGADNGLIIQRGEYAQFDVDGDGYDDFRLRNTNYAGIGGIGSVQLNTSIDPFWYGAPGTNPSFPNAGATYAQIYFRPPAIIVPPPYYIRSFVDNEVIGLSNPYCREETPAINGRYYGLLSQYPGWDERSFWNPSFSPWAELGYGYDYNEYAGLRIVDTNGVQHWAWVRFQVILHDEANVFGFGIPDGMLTQHDLLYDTNRQVILYDFAYETTPDVDIIAGAVPEPGCLGLLAAGLGALSLRRRQP